MPALDLIDRLMVATRVIASVNADFARDEIAAAYS